MDLEEGCDYVTIKRGNMVYIGDAASNWTPDDAHGKHGVILKGKHSKYLSMLFKIENIKPYPERRRMNLVGVFFEGSMFEGEKKVRAWKEDLIFYTFNDGELVPHIPIKRKKKPRETRTANPMRLNVKAAKLTNEIDD